MQTLVRVCVDEVREKRNENDENIQFYFKKTSEKRRISIGYIGKN